MATFRSYPTLTHPKPGSQESLASYSSGTQSSTVQSMAASSEANSHATLSTTRTSPPSHNTHYASDATTSASKSANATADRTDSAHAGQRLRTPEQRYNAYLPPQQMASPMALSTPSAGHKRSASGEVKYPQATSPAVAQAVPATQWRRFSNQSSTSSVGEAASTLKDRLAYAMAKVQHGWEHHNIDQVEHLAASLSPRNAITPRSASGRPQHASPRAHPLPSRSLIDNFVAPQNPYHDTRQLPPPIPMRRPSSSASSMSPPRKRSHDLAPAAGLASPSSSHRRTNSNTYQSSYTPTTPKAERRPPTIRTQMQTAQAEQEAMDALLLMGSPSNGGHFPRGSQRSSATESPNRREHHRAPSFNGPRMALQYRSESGDSIPSSTSSHFGYSHGQAAAEVMRQRADVLDQIEAET